MKKLLTVMGIMLLLGLGCFTLKTSAAELQLSITSSDGSQCLDILDQDYNSYEDFQAGTTLTLNASEPIDSVYIKWNTIPTAWKMTDGDKQVDCGQNGFLHEFVQLSGTNNSVTITIPDGGATIADVFAFSAGELPSYVQKWEPSWDKADLLFISTHSDDEVLFFGGMIPIYTNQDRARVQVAYFCDFFLTEPYRNHELLDGIWEMGVDHYPQLGEFPDNYCESLEEAEGLFDVEAGREYIVRTIRRFQPKVLVTHDINGEYGHGAHILVSKLVREAVEITQDSSKYPESASAYGTWDVPKTYLHLYAENPIEMKTREPLEDFGGRNALQVSKDAYLKHQSQQWMVFVADDGYDDQGQPNGYEYSNAKFGLYRTTVGNDFSGDDVLDNLVTYDQEALEAQKALEEQEKESSLAEEAEQEETQTKAKLSSPLIIVVIILAVIAIVLLILLIAVKRKKKKQQEMLRLQRRKQQAARRAASQQQAVRRDGSRQTSVRREGERPEANTRSGSAQPARRSNATQQAQGQASRSTGRQTTVRRDIERPELSNRPEDRLYSDRQDSNRRRGNRKYSERQANYSRDEDCWDDQ